MALMVDDLTELDSAAVIETKDRMTAMLREAYPLIDFRSGPVHGVLLELAAAINESMNEEVARNRQSQSLLAIEENPTGADDDRVDEVMSNYGIVRQPGGQATGNITIIVSKLVPLVIAVGSRFQGNGVEFTTTAAHAVRTSANDLVAPTDRALVPLGDGRFAFNIPITASVAGASGMLRRGTPITPLAPPANFVSAAADADFTGGVNPQTNADLLAAQKTGVAAKTWSNRFTIPAMILEQEEFKGIVAMSIIGMDDPEMRRDQHTIWPTSFGGRADLYVRTQFLPQSTTVVKTATLVGVSSGQGVWQVEFDRDDSPGFYFVDGFVRLADVANQIIFHPTSDNRSFNTADDEVSPDIELDDEATYSRFQTAILRFVDTETATDGMTINSTTAEYRVLVKSMPLIKDLQDFIGSRDRCAPAGDVLVRAAVPGILTVNMDIYKRGSQAAPDTDAIANAFADAVNQLGFTPAVYGLSAAQAIADLIPDGMRLGGLDMDLAIRSATGEMLYVRSQDVLEIPDRPELGVTGRTVAVMLDPSDINITVKNTQQTGE